MGKRVNIALGPNTGEIFIQSKEMLTDGKVRITALRKGDNGILWIIIKKVVDC